MMALNILFHNNKEWYQYKKFVNVKTKGPACALVGTDYLREILEIENTISFVKPNYTYWSRTRKCCLVNDYVFRFYNYGAVICCIYNQSFLKPKLTSIYHFNYVAVSLFYDND